MNVLGPGKTHVSVTTRYFILTVYSLLERNSLQTHTHTHTHTRTHTHTHTHTEPCPERKWGIKSFEPESVL